MAIQSVNQLKQWFETGDKPTQQQFWDWLDSFVHKSEGIAIENVAGLLGTLQAKADLSTLADYVAIQNGIIMVDDVSDLQNIDIADARFVIVKQVAIFLKMETAALPNWFDSFPSASAGWLWEVVLWQGAGGSGVGMLADRFAINSDDVYQLDSGYAIDKIKIKPSIAQILRIGTTNGGEELMIETTIPGGEWYTITLDVDADGTDVLIYINGATNVTNVIMYKREL